MLLIQLEFSLLDISSGSGSAFHACHVDISVCGKVIENS